MEDHDKEMVNFGREPKKYQSHFDRPERSEKTGFAKWHSHLSFPLLFRLIVTAVLLLFCVQAGLSQDYLYDKWGVKEGLPQNTVRQILQTSDGYLWIATEGGLARFDGLEFTVYNTQNTPALLSNRISRIFENTNGDLLIGATDGGLALYRDNRFINMSDSLGYPFHSYYHFTWDAKGRIVGRISGTTDFKTHDPITYKLVDDQIKDSLLLKTLSTADTDYYFYRDSIVRRTVSERKSFEETMDISLCKAVKGMEADDLWILTGTELCHIVNFKKEECFAIEDKAFQASNYTLFSLTKGKLYIVEYQSDVLVFDLSSSTFSTMKFGEICEDAQLEDVYEDREGNLWYSSTTCGLIKENPERFTYLDQLNDSKNANTYPICVGPKKKIWVGTRESGLLIYDSLSNELSLPDNFGRTGFALSIEPMANDLYFYFLGSDYIVKWDGSRQHRFYYPEREKYDARGIYAAKTEGLLVGTDRGVLIFNDREELVEHPVSEKANLNYVVNIHEDLTGLVWVVCRGEVICYDPATYDVVHQFGKATKQKGFYRGISEGEDGTIYIGSYGNGLMVIKNGEMKRITTDQGLAENVVSSITSDGNGNIWLTGNKGLSRIDKSELTALLNGKLEKLDVILYDEQTDGLRTGEFNGGIQQSKAHLGANKYLFPTLKGAVFIDFDRMNFNELPPPVHVEKLFFRDSTILVQDRVSLPYSEERLEISYTALSFTSPKNVRFKYRLEGYEKNWSKVGAERKTSYSKLPPGTYVFRVVASNNEGVWNEEGDQLIIEIVPPFYMTDWFRLLMVLLGLIFVGLVAYGVIRYNKKQLIAKQRLRLESIVNTEEKERQRIAKDLHDGVGQLLSSVKMNLTNTESKLKDDRAVGLLAQSKRDIDQIAAELRNISYNLLPSSLEKFGLATAMEEQINKLEKNGTVNLHFNNSTEETRFDPKVEITLYRVFQEMLNNTLKHAEATEITVQLLQFGTELQLMFEDNGKGFNLKSGIDKAGSSGLQNLYSRVALINGKMVIDSHANAGTVIIVDVNL